MKAMERVHDHGAARNYAFGSLPWIRTTIHGVKGRRPTVRRIGSRIACAEEEVSSFQSAFTSTALSNSITLSQRRDGACSMRPKDVETEFYDSVSNLCEKAVSNFVHR